MVHGVKMTDLDSLSNDSLESIAFSGFNWMEKLRLGTLRYLKEQQEKIERLQKKPNHDSSLDSITVSHIIQHVELLGREISQLKDVFVTRCAKGRI